VKSYELAREIPEVLARQPCYCWCEGHGSLLGATRPGTRTTERSVLEEVLLADRLTAEGKTASEVREAIIRGDWKAINLDRVRREIGNRR
jgi:hypothetical protein